MKLEDLEALSEAYAPPPSRKPSRGGGNFYPDLNPTQDKIFNDNASFVLGYGEKGSGKSIGFGHKIVRHCYEEENALSIIIAPTTRTGVEGIWYDLDNLILPQWAEGMGLEYTESKLDPLTKDRHRWIGNRFGSWSKVLVMSIPYASQVESRIKGPAPSQLYLDEIANCESDKYFTFPAAQLGRRRSIRGPQQFLASCNPEGPSHWVYKRWWQDCVDPDSGKRDPRYSVHHVPIKENISRLPDRYIDHLDAILKDPVERRRLIDGEWVDRPSGESIFKDSFIPEIHVRGDAFQNVGIVPHKAFPIVVGYDPGPVNFSIHFMQMIPTKDKTVWTVFDELNYVGTYTLYSRVIGDVLRKMDFWNNRCGHQFLYEHITDDAAFSSIRSDGSFDAAEIQRLGKGRIRLRGCPKGKDSVPARVRMTVAALMEEGLLISAMCPKTIDMLTQLRSEKEKPGKYDPNTGLRPIRSIHLHPFDSMTYPMFYYYMLMPGGVFTGGVKPIAFNVGAN